MVIGPGVQRAGLGQVFHGNLYLHHRSDREISRRSQNSGKNLASQQPLGPQENDALVPLTSGQTAVETKASFVRCCPPDASPAIERTVDQTGLSAYRRGSLDVFVMRLPDDSRDLMGDRTVKLKKLSHCENEIVWTLH
ncbi:hypothetical protein PGT21_010665 [Puccinia graminis f. sp. tritici]|uniref:Uncharacterized protein n=1 Tax=Puccinia graminis f. sp. tritici TaxID=56615 RepID=A0A5B0LK55_PUCGR|nr:hypothetical protein PGT21_010665 [Puccinia graminis f. sp. tritici]